jgi:hypothetical protein
MKIPKISTHYSEEEVLSHIKTAIRYVLNFKATEGEEDLIKLEIIAKDILNYMIKMKDSEKSDEVPFFFINTKEAEFKGDIPVFERRFFIGKKGPITVLAAIKMICMEYINKLRTKKDAKELSEPEKIIWRLVNDLLRRGENGTENRTRRKRKTPNPEQLKMF